MNTVSNFVFPPNKCDANRVFVKFCENDNQHCCRARTGSLNAKFMFKWKSSTNHFCTDRQSWMSLGSSTVWHVLGLGLEAQVLGLGLDGQVLSFSLGNQAPASIPTTVKKYLDFIREQSCSAGHVYSWKAVQKEADFKVLHHQLEKIFCSPATSAPVCRVFSHSSCAHSPPHCARMGDKMLSDLVFLKCNKHV